MRNGSQNNTKNSPHYTLNRLSTVLFYLSILFFIIGFGFTDSVTGNWYQQFMPNIGNKQITDITFLDSLTGYAVARQTSDSSYILKTTDGGNNWQIIFRNFFAMTQIQFLNVNTGYACGAYLFKTTDGGFNWSQVTAPAISPEELYVLDENTIWIISSNSLVGGVFFTSNGGVNWQPQLSAGNQNPDHIYMYNRNIGFVANNISGTPSLRKTTNGGVSWFPVLNEAFTDMYFTDSLTGWKAHGNMKKTTDGGLNWVNQPLPSGGNILVSQIVKFSNISRDTIWGVGSTIMTGSGSRGIIFKSTNGGQTWGYQLPDTVNINIFQYQYVKFSNPLIGWAYTGNKGVHTTTGGDTTIYTAINQISTEVPKEFKLHQNYPNPFNPRTIINYQVMSNIERQTSNVKIVVYDITGKEVIKLVDQKQKSGTYQVDFSGNGYSSGVYFYSLYSDDKLIDSKKMILLK